MHGPFPDPQIVADGLAVALRGDALAIWPIAADNELNRGLAVELEFSDHAVCAVKLPEASARGATITIGRRDVSAVEAAVCDNEEGSCVPVRIVFPDRSDVRRAPTLPPSPSLEKSALLSASGSAMSRNIRRCGGGVRQPSTAAATHSGRSLYQAPFTMTLGWQRNCHADAGRHPRLSLP